MRGLWLAIGMVWGAANLAAQSGPPPWAALGSVRRIYIDRFSGGEGAQQIRDMILASLQRSGVVVVTENPERADAVLRGSADDVVFVDVYQSSEGVNGHINLGSGRGTSTRSRDYSSVGAGVSESESARQQERRHEAFASVRLVAKDGDVIWATTQASLGAKFLSAGADVANRIMRQWMQDVEALRGGTSKAPGGQE